MKWWQRRTGNLPGLYRTIRILRVINVLTILVLGGLTIWSNPSAQTLYLRLLLLCATLISLWVFTNPLLVHSEGYGTLGMKKENVLRIVIAAQIYLMGKVSLLVGKQLVPDYSQWGSLLFLSSSVWASWVIAPLFPFRKKK